MKNKKACAPISGRTNWAHDKTRECFTCQVVFTEAVYLIELVAEVDRVNVVTFQIREHDDLSTQGAWLRVDSTSFES